MKKAILAATLTALVGISGLHANSESLLDKVKDYLGSHGLPKLEYFSGHAIVMRRDGSFNYRQMYLIDNQPFIADFYPYSPELVDQDTMVASFDNGADMYYYYGTWYADPRCDGINGNEELLNPVSD